MRKLRPHTGRNTFYVSSTNLLLNSWATPAQQLKVQRFKPGGTAIDAEYHLNVYERNVQVPTMKVSFVRHNCYRGQGLILFIF